MHTEISVVYSENTAVAWLLRRVRLSVTPWTVTHQAFLSMGFPRQEYWCGLPFPSPGDRPSPGIEPAFPALAAVLPGNGKGDSPLPMSHHGSPENTVRCSKGLFPLRIPNS